MLVSLLSLALVPLWSEVDLTPPEPLPLGGYTERGDANFAEIEHRLFGRAIAFETEQGRVVVASLEMLTVPSSLAEAVQTRVGPDTTVLLVATHTHNAPDSQMLNSRMTIRIPGIAPYNSRWLEWYADQIAELCIAAPKVSAKLTASRFDHNFARPRRPEAEAATNDWVIWDDGELLLTTYSAHPTVLNAENKQTHGDFPGVYMRQSGGLALPSALGDQSPNTQGASPVENLKSLVENMTASIDLSPLQDHFKVDGKWQFREARVELGSPTPHPDFVSQFGVPAPLAQVVIERFSESQADVSILSSDELCFVFLPAEPSRSVVDLVTKLADDHGFPHCVVVALTNGWIGYLLDADDYARGGYESALMFHGPEAAEKILAGLASVLIGSD